jgi:hypothetical protein
VAKKTVKINRAPVLTLWAAVVAERLGFDWSAALSIGKAVAGLNAQAKGRRLGIYARREAAPGEREREKWPPEQEMVEVLSRPVPIANTPQGTRATIKGEVIDAEGVERYLKGKFGEDLGDVRDAMEALAKSMVPEELEAQAYSLYEEFRPEIPQGKRGWGVAGELDLDRIRKMAKR